MAVDSDKLSHFNKNKLERAAITISVTTDLGPLVSPLANSQTRRDSSLCWAGPRVQAMMC